VRSVRYYISDWLGWLSVKLDQLSLWVEPPTLPPRCLCRPHDPLHVCMPECYAARSRKI
jgi:hypothetical protein